VAEPLYVYALVHARRDAPLGTGIDGLPLRSVSVGRLAAVVHDHPGAPYGGSDEEVRRRALEHNGVVERLWQEDRAILPMSFDVIVTASQTESAEQRLGRWLEEVAPGADARLAAVRGRVELRVDIGLDQATAASGDEEVRALQEEAERSSPGVQRLQRKRVLRREHDLAERRADALYPEVRERLARLSADIVENQRGAAEPHEVLVLSTSLLVDEDAVPEVGRELRAIGAEEPAARIRFYGPWPPYSFADLARPGEVPEAAGGPA
jgi:Gas vesicle synthesis protein GvpL/GvpF